VTRPVGNGPLQMHATRDEFEPRVLVRRTPENPVSGREGIVPPTKIKKGAHEDSLRIRIGRPATG
jgi:hypothetical protein